MVTSAATAHVLVGFIGSGKTTFAKKLERRMSATRYSYDEWMIRFHGRNPPEARFAEYFKTIEELIWNDAERQLRAGRDVIIDAGLWSRRSRDRLRCRIREIGANAKLYFVTCPEAVMLDRVLERSRIESKDSLWIDKPAFEKLIKGFEPMRPDEKFVSVDGTAER